MKVLNMKIEWEGPLSIRKTIEEKNDAGDDPDFEGNDYGLYQIYGRHILCGDNSLLYIGEVTQRTFSNRIKEHYEEWLNREENVRIYLGRILNWEDWEKDVKRAEAILIYKYSPNYNGRGLGDKPSLAPYKKIRLIHSGEKNKLKLEDTAPDDF